MISYRFDIDTLTCIEDGIPPLLDLAKKYGLRFTFFVNLGRSVSRFSTLQKVFNKRGGRSNGMAAKIKNKEKLGVKNYARTVFFNPPLIQSRRAKANLYRAKNEGHILGLHGGTNHGVWQHHVHQLSKKELEELFDPAYEIFSKLFGNPLTFAAPGFQTNDMVKALLSERGFLSHGDDFGPGKVPYEDPWKLTVEPVTLIGEQSVALLEQHAASGLSPDESSAEVTRMATNQSFNLLYGHPCFEGLAGKPWLEAAIKSLQSLS